jgi:hypothetical protein
MPTQSSFLDAPVEPRSHHTRYAWGMLFGLNSSEARCPIRGRAVLGSHQHPMNQQFEKLKSSRNVIQSHYCIDYLFPQSCRGLQSAAPSWWSGYIFKSQTFLVVDDVFCCHMYCCCQLFLAGLKFISQETTWNCMLSFK